jgi:hypothetical protein
MGVAMPAATNRKKKKLICHPFVLRTKFKKKKKNVSTF